MDKLDLLIEIGRQLSEDVKSQDESAVILADEVAVFISEVEAIKRGITEYNKAYKLH